MVKIAIQSHIAIEKIARERRLHEQKERVQNPIISCLARSVWQKYINSWNLFVCHCFSFGV